MIGIADIEARHDWAWTDETWTCWAGTQEKRCPADGHLWPCDTRQVLDALRAAEPPAGTRLVLVSEDAATLFFGRNGLGDLLTFEWGEPDEHGWYAPTITQHPDDNPIRAAEAREARLRAAANHIAARLDTFCDWCGGSRLVPVRTEPPFDGTYPDTEPCLDSIHAAADQVRALAEPEAERDDPDTTMPCVEDGTHSDDLAHQYEYEHHVGRHAPKAKP